MNLHVYLCIFLSVTISVFNSSYSYAAKQWKSKCAVLNIPNAKIRIRARGRMAKIRCESDFTMIEGDRRLTCIKGKWNGRIPQCISSGCSIDSVPNGGAIELYDGALLHFHCNPGYTLTGSPALFCDGLNWNASYPQCQVPPPNPDHLACTFETNNLCGWVQDHVDDLDWKWTTGTNNAFSGSLGAKTDHTLLSPAGHYIFADSKDDWFHGSVARLFSPILSNPVQSPSCVIFWYHMNGQTTGSLNVYIKPESDQFEMLSPAMTVTGYNQDAWKLGYIGLPELDEDFLQVIFEAKGGDEHNSDIAIDDFLVTFGEECIETEIKLIEQQSFFASQTSPVTNGPILTRPAKLTTKSKGKLTTTTTTEAEEDYSYIPFSTSSLKISPEQTSISPHSDKTSAAPLESTIKASTPRKIYISTHKPTLPIIVVPTPPTNIILTSFLPRRTLTPILITTPTVISNITNKVAITKELTTSVPHAITTLKDTLLTKGLASHNLTNSILFVSSSKLLTKSTTAMSITSLIPANVASSFRPMKPIVKSTTNFPITLPPKYSSHFHDTTMSSIRSPKKIDKSTKALSQTTKSTKIKPPTKYTKNPYLTFKPKTSSSNQLHTRPLPGVVILISIVAVGLVVTGLLLGIIWFRRLRKRPFLEEDSDVRQLKEEEEDHTNGGNEDIGNSRRTFPTSYRPLENSTFPQEYDGTPV